MPFNFDKSDPIIPSDPQRKAASMGNMVMGTPINTLDGVNKGSGFGANLGMIIGALGCLTPVFIFGFIFYNGFFAADLFPKSVHGTFTDGTIIPAGKNAGKLFFIMDDSFYFTSEVETPGSYSVSTESLFNKTYSYVYDAPKEEVLERTKTTYGSKTPGFHIFTIGDSIWTVGDGSSGGKPELHVLDTNTNQETLNLQSFTDKFPEFKSGIYEMRYFDSTLFYKHFSIKTLDGRSYEYYPNFDRLAASDYDLMNWLYVNKFDDMSKVTTGWVLDGSDRKELYLVKGIKAGVISAVQGQNKDDYIDSTYTTEYVKRNGEYTEPTTITSTKVDTDLAFLKGEVLYQDSDIILILHQQDARDLAPKMLTLVDKDKGVVWTADEDKLLPQMRTNPNDTFTQMFFIRDHFSAERVKDSIMVKFKEVGIIAFDISTGNVAWTFNPNKAWF